MPQQKTTRLFWIIVAAIKRLGAPYLYGAPSNSTGFDAPTDCSEFIKDIAAEGGVILPDGSYNQISAGREIPMDHACANVGHLLFMVRQGGEVHHVGLSLGDDLSIEAVGGAIRKVAVLANASRRYQTAVKVDAFYEEAPI